MEKVFRVGAAFAEVGLTCSCKSCSFTYIIPSYIIRHFSWTIHALWYYSSGLIHIYIVLVYMSIPKKSVPST